MNERKNDRWFLLLFMAFAIPFAGCDDSPGQPAEARYLGPPVVEQINKNGQYHKLDAWRIRTDNFPEYAAFGWRVTYHWRDTGDTFTEPGIRTTFRRDSGGSPGWSPLLRCSVRGPDGTEADETITGTSLAGGSSTFYLTLYDWPAAGDIANNFIVRFDTEGLPPPENHGSHAASSANFGQDRAEFYLRGGALDISYQDWLMLGSYSMANSPPMLDSMPYDSDPTPPLPRLLAGLIPPALEECSYSPMYPLYKDPNGTGGGILVRSRWMKARVSDDEWDLFPATFVTLLPSEPNKMGKMTEAAWPYLISYHTPVESAGLGTMAANLSITDPNGLAVTSIGIEIHEAGECSECGGWIWRSDYLLPLAVFPAPQGPLLVREGDVLAYWLPNGHSIRVDPVIGYREIRLLCQSWLTQGNILDINMDGVVNFKDYAAFFRK